MGKFWSSVENIVTILVVLGIAGFIIAPGPGYKRNVPLSRKKSCVSNMKTIEGALELYFMENKFVPNAFVGTEVLKNNGYLKSVPVCPVAGPTPGYGTRSEMALDKTVISDIECRVHGKLSLQDTTDKSKGL